MSHKTVNPRYRRPYAPPDLMVLRGPGDHYEQGSHWIVGDDHGFAEIILMKNCNAYLPNTLYIENIVIKENLRGQGHGRELYRKVELFARNIGMNYIQIDSEDNAVGFWKKMNYTKLDIVYYQNKTAMIKEV